MLARQQRDSPRQLWLYRFVALAKLQLHDLLELEMDRFFHNGERFDAWGARQSDFFLGRTETGGVHGNTSARNF